MEGIMGKLKIYNSIHIHFLHEGRSEYLHYILQVVEGEKKETQCLGV
jgi:hypothetical protein